MGIWQLFVDESGTIKAGDPSVVAGLLLQGPVNPPTTRALRAMLDASLPGVPWPPHATTLNIPASRALFARRDGAASPFAKACAPALSALKTPRAPGPGEVRRAELLSRVEAALTWSPRHWQPPSRDLHALMSEVDDWIFCHARGAYGGLGALRDEADRERAQAQRQISAVVGGGHAAAVGAWWDGAEALTPAMGLDAYLHLLSALIERATEAVRSFDDSPRHLVLLHVAARNVHTGGAPTPLTRAHLYAAVRAAGGRVVRPTCPVDVVPMQPRPFDAGADPGVVVADHIANRIRERLRGGAADDWRAVETRVEDATGVHPALRTRVGYLPLLTPAGAAREVLRAYWQGTTAPSPPPQPPWVTEQLYAWIEAT